MTRRKRMLEDLDRDIQEHIERETQDNIDRGMSAEEARYAALRKFGNVRRVKEDTWEVWNMAWLEQLWQDVRFGLRMLLRNPGFSLVAALTLALGIGANTYIFSVVDALVFRPLAFAHPNRLVALWERVPRQGNERGELSPSDFLDWQAQNHVFDHMAAQSWWDANLGGVERPEHLHGFLVTPDFFAAIEAEPMLGRAFEAEDGTPGKNHVAVLSYALWREDFGADPAVAGKTVLLNGVPTTVVGVMGPQFGYPSGAQVWGALAFTPEERTWRGAHYLHGVGHLAPGVSLQQAQVEMNAIAGRLAQQYPKTNTGRGANVMPLMDSEVGQARAPLLILLAAVGLVLLIACANISNLLLARAESRRRESAIRAALGATRRRLIRQWLVESLLLGVVSGALGIGLAFLCLKLQVIRIPAEFARMIPGWSKIGINLPVLVFTSAVSLGTGLIFGLLPALGASRINVSTTLKEGAPSSGHGRRRRFLRNLLIVAEVGLSVALLTAAGLMMKSFVRLESVPPGFNPDKLLTMSVALPSAQYKTDQQVASFYEQMIDRVQGLPGVQSAAVANMLPLGGANTTNTIRVEGRPEPKPGQDPEADFRSVSDAYFQTMQVPLLQGRAFTTQDNAEGQPVVAINQAFAKRFWPGENAIGKRIRFSGPPASNPWQTVVAVVGNMKTQLDEPAPAEMYFPLRQQTKTTMVLVVRTSTAPHNLVEAVRGQVSAVDPNMPLFDVMTMEDWRSVSVAPQKIGGTLMGAFAALALVLTATGLFGVIAYAVSERTHEIGIRMSLGAGPREVFRLVVGQGMLLTLIGLAVGLPLALGVGRLVSGLLYGVAPNDFGTFAGVAVLLAGVALAACWIPARRAMRVDPMVALRSE
jgi:predicted permease